MKKQKLTKLSLKKSSISNLQNRTINNQNHLVGGGSFGERECPTFYSWLHQCVQTDPETQGCSMECTAGCNDTFTCRNWSCDCNDEIV